ncbi:MAG: flagellin, partial [Thermoguttaceae bacterium]
MTGLYVASNVKALGSQINLQRNVNNLGDVLTRLSTGLKINSAKDDPAGLIASELLKSDITATKTAIQNTQRANSVIAVADSALGQVSTLLNDIRSLVNQSANDGAMTSDMIAANQLQIDASIDSIDRISKTTNFQGKLLLDGSMSFSTEGVNANGVKTLDNLQINAANFGDQKEVNVKIDVQQMGQKAAQYYDKSGVSEETV